MKSTTHLRGQAGVYAVSAQLCLRGLTPCFPAVDDGVDIMLTNGLRLQVKAGLLRIHPGYQQGAYCLDLRRGWKRKGREIVSDKANRYEGKCDFIIFYGIDEHRFFIIPLAEVTQSFWIARKGSPNFAPKIYTFEDAWHLLDVDSTLSGLESEVDAETRING